MRQFSLALGAACLLALTGCTGGQFNKGGSSATNEAGVFRYPIRTNPTSFDPGIVQDGDTLDLLQNVYEGLVTWNEENEVVGAVAESWKVSDDGKTYTFTLKKGVKFHNGREVKAEDFKWSIERALDPKIKSSTALAYLDDIVGAAEKNSGAATEVSGWKTIDDYTLSIEVKKPTPYFLGKLTYLVSAVLPKELVPADKEISQMTEMIGTGPFKVESYDRDQQTTLAAFKDYHGGAPQLSKITRPVIKDALTKLNKYKNGELDVTDLQRQDIAGLEKDPEMKAQLKYFNRPSIWYIGLNQLVYPPFKDARVRQAFAMSIDKKKIVDELMGGVNEIANGIVPPGIPGHRPDAKGLAFDPAKAKALLAEAGYGPNKPLPPLELYFREAFPDIKLVAEAAAGMLKENLGVEVKLKTMEWRAYLEKQNKKELPFYHMRWAADYLDPQNFLSHMLATWGPENKLGYSNAKFDELCRTADSELDMEKRKPLYAQAEDIALQDGVWIPIYFQRDAELHRAGVTGMRESLFGHLPHTKTTVQASK